MSTKTAVALALSGALGAAAAPDAKPTPGPSPLTNLGPGRVAYDQGGVIKVLDLETGKIDSYDLPERMERPYWDAAGKRFLYNSDFGISVLDIAAQSFTALTPANQKGVDPAWSADGKRAAFEVKEGADAGLYLFDFADKKVTKIPLTLAGSQPDFTPAGDKLVFTSAVGGVDHLFLLDLACLKDGKCDAAAKQLTKDGKGSRAAAVSPDGKRVAFEREDGQGPGLAVMAIDGSGLKRLSAAKSSDGNPAWGGDEWIVFERDATEAGKGGSLFIIKADGTGAKQVAKPEAEADGSFKDMKHPHWTIAKK